MLEMSWARRRASRRASRWWNVWRLLWVAGLLLVASLGAPTPASATAYTWQGPAGGGDWTNPANWNPSTGFPNGPTDRVQIIATTAPQVLIIPASASPITIAGISVRLQGGPVTIVGVNSTLVFSPGIGERAFETESPLVFQVPVRLAADCFAEVTAPLTFQLVVSEDGRPRSFTKRGSGTAIFAARNTFTGTTVVAAGELHLTQPNVIADSAPVSVFSNGILRAQRNETIGALEIVGGQVDISGTFTVSSLDMTGGTIVGSGVLLLDGNVTATSFNTPATIGPPIVLGTATRTFTINDGDKAPDMLIQGVIAGNQADPTLGLIKDGAGSLQFNSPTTYPGLTWVKEGPLALNQAIAGDLRIGDGVGPAGQATTVSGNDNLIDDQHRVIVEADGAYDLAATRDTLDLLTVNGGIVHIRASGIQPGILSVRALAMNGGTIDTEQSTSGSGELRMRNVPNVRIETTPTATQRPIISGAGKLVLDGSPDLVVNNGPQPIDLEIQTAIVSGTGQGLRKTGPGVARFTSINTYAGPTNVEGGTLLVNGSQAASTINVRAGTLGGNGLAGPIVGTAGGTIAPGQSPGMLSSGSVQLAAGATFAAELQGATAGAGYDQLRVNGTVALGNATLALTLGANTTLPLNAKLTIIDNDGADPVTGTFASLAAGATIIVPRHVLALTYNGGDGNDIVLTVTEVTPPVDDPTPNALIYYLAEGATGGFFDEDVSIANPNDTDAPVTLTFLQEGGGTVVEHRTVPKQARLTVHVDQIAGLENASPSVQVASDQKLPLIVERSMFWDTSGYGGHTANAVAKPEMKWILAEGFQGFFDTYLLIANANATPTTTTVTFLRENDTPVTKVIPIAAFARKTIYAGEISELIGRAFGIVIEATQPVIAERSMYFASLPNRLWTGGHVNTGVTAPSTSWFHAEGATGGFFSTFILLSNPQTTDAHVELRFLLEDGTTIVKTKTLPAGQRLTVNPASEGEPRLENAAMSTIVASDVPIVSERSMYWPGDATPFGEGHNSSGIVSTATRWGLAEGRIGAPRNFTTYILLANPTTTAANVTVTYLRETGAPVTKTYTVPPTSRFNIDVAGVVPELRDESFGARIEVTNGVPIAVERSLYWDANGIFWAGGTNALATPLP
jgi:autotransporter-associated beta strand protein